MKYILSLLLLFAIAACRKNKDSQENGNNNVQPRFRVGTKWTYHYTFYNNNGSVANEDDLAYEVLKDTMINGSRYYKATNDYFFCIKPDGFYEFDRANNQEHLQYRNPVTTGTSYKSAKSLYQATTCDVSFDALTGNTDTSVILLGKLYDKLISYRFTTYSNNCQYIPGYSDELYSTKFGLRIFSSYYYGYPSYNLTIKIELKSFTY